MFKQAVKSTLEHLIAIAGPHVWPSIKPKLLIVMYHRILPPSDPRYKFEQPSMIVHPDTFEQHIKWLKEYFTLIDLDEWLQLVAANKSIPKNACAITFDDGWKDNYEFAYPVLLKEKCPATIYLVSDYINSQTTFWPEKLSFLLTQIAAHKPELFQDKSFSWMKELNCRYQFTDVVPDKYELDDLIKAAKKYSDEFIHEKISLISELANIKLHFEDILNEKEITEMRRSGLVSFGSHTATHTRMSDSLSSDILDYELVNSKQKLTDRYNLDIRTFCYPNGDVSESAKIVIKKHYQAAVTTNKKWNNLSHAPYDLNRIGVHEASTKTKAGFLTKISGFL